jgi:hypothetical protein
LVVAPFDRQTQHGMNAAIARVQHFTIRGEPKLVNDLALRGFCQRALAKRHHGGLAANIDQEIFELLGKFAGVYFVGGEAHPPGVFKDCKLSRGRQTSC